MTELEVCDPSIEQCEWPFKNDIELNYRKPNLTVFYVDLVNAIVPWALYTFWQQRNLSAAETAIYANNLYYQQGWAWISRGSTIMYVFPTVAWVLQRITDSNFLVLFLAFWWFAVQRALTPLLFTIGPFLMYKGLYNGAGGSWDPLWEEAFTKVEIWSVIFLYIIFEGASYYLFMKNFNSAWLYYDEYLQEQHEEIIQFGEPEKQEPIPVEAFTL